MAGNSRQPRRNNRPSSVKLLQRPDSGLAAFADASVDAFLLFDDNLDLMSINPAGEILFGFSKEMVVGKNIVELEPDIKETGKYDKYLDVMKTGDLFFVEEPFSHPKFGDMHLGIKAFKVREGLGMIVNDITERRQMEEALRESELLATATIEGMSDGVMLVGMDGKVAYVNKAFERMLGYKASELAGTSAVDLPTYRESKDRKKARQALKMVIEKGSAEPIDMIALSKDGVEIPINFAASVVKDAKGNPKTLVAVIRDVTERRKAEEALRQSEEYFRALIENAQDAIVVVGEDVSIVHASPAVERVLGYKPEELVGTDGFSLVNPDDKPLVMKAFAGLGENPDSVGGVELRIRHKDGSWRVVEAVAKNLLSDEAVKGIVVNWRDITERKKAEEALKESEERYRRLVDNAQDIIFRFSADKGLEYVSPAVSTIMGYSAEELRGNPELALGLATAKDEKLAKDYQEVISEGKSMRTRDITAIRKDGKQVYLDMRSQAVRDKDGNVVAFEGILRDITERKQMEEEVRLLSDAVRMTTDSIAITDISGRVLDINEAGLRMYGLSDRADFVGKNPLDAIAPEDRRKAIENMAKIMETGQVKGIEYHVLRKDGSRILIETSVSLIKDCEGKPKGLVAVARDITERKRMEEALRQSEKKYRQLFEIMQEGLWLIDKDSITIFVNPRMAEILGYTAEEMLGKHLFEFMDERGIEVAKYNLERRRQGIKEQHDFEFTRKDGARVYASLETSPIVDEEGNYIGALACVADITARKEVQETLQNSEEYFRSLIENAQDAIVIVAGDGTISYGSPSIERMLGYKPEELISADALFGFAHPDDIPNVVDTFANFTKNGNVSGSIELRIRHKDGSWRVVEAVANNLLENRAIKGIVVNWRDVTARKKAEEALKESEARYRMLADNAGDVIWATDMNLRITYISPSITQLSGYSVEEAMALTPEKMMLPDSLKAIMDAYSEGMAALRESTVVEAEVKRKDGSTVPVEMSTKLLKGVDGKPFGILGVTRDITERKKAEKVLRESEERFRAIFDNSVDGILVTDLETNSFYTCNKAMCQMLGYNLEEIRNLKVTDIHPKKDLPYVVAEMERERQGKSPAGVKVLPLVRKDGSVLHAEVTPSLVTFAGRQYLAGIFRDISERRKAEEEKQRMEEQLRLAGRLAAVGELAAGVAHELNNPLAAIQGYSQFLSSSNNLDEATKKDLETIYKEALRASKITHNLLSFARRHEPEKKFISLNEVVENTIELRAHPLKVSNIELVTELAPDLPKTMADFYQLQQVFVNLINNAEQAMVAAHGKGKLVIKTQKSDEVIQVTFTDDGPGISEENMKRIFDPFFTTKDVGKGTGLGLPICYGIVEAHGGRIYARSKLGAGATFIVEIPILLDAESK